MTGLKQPNGRLTLCGWLIAAVPFDSAMVGLTLPQDPTKWSATGFVRVGPTVGGTPNAYNPSRAPVLSVHVYGCNLTQPTPTSPPNVSLKPAWDRTSQLCEQIMAVCGALQDGGFPRQVAMPPAGYAHAMVNSVVALTEPREIEGDPASYAHYQLDMQVAWVPEAV